MSNSFKIEDYAVVLISFVVTLLIGCYHYSKFRKTNSPTEKRNVSILPVAVSLSITYVSAITLLGVPAEVYMHGTMFTWYCASILIVIIICSEVFIPKFYELEVTSTYEYLEKRFSQKVRLIGTANYLVQITLYSGVILYAPSLALSKISGVDRWTSVLVMGSIAVTYTAMGEIKALIWADVFQALVMLAGLLSFIVGGSLEVGGFSEVWKINEVGERVDFLDIGLDPRRRHTVWGVLVGGTLLWLSNTATDQSFVQQCLCCKSVKRAKKALYLSWIGISFFTILCVICGMVAYAKLSICDPLANGTISTADEVLPYLTLELFASFPGMSGLVMSSIFCSSLGSFSLSIEGMTVVSMEDFIKPHTNLKEIHYKIVRKMMVLFWGAFSIGFAYIAFNLGEIQEVCYSLSGLFAGPQLGIFVMGFLFPFCNSLGGIVGMICGFLCPLWIYIGSLFSTQAAEFNVALPLSTDGCLESNQTNFSQTMNATYNNSKSTENPFESFQTSFSQSMSVSLNNSTSTENPFENYIYQISYVYYSLIGFVVTIIFGVITSLMSGGWNNRANINPKYLLKKPVSLQGQTAKMKSIPDYCSSKL